MPAPKGNQYAKDSKGGTGRPTYVNEIVRAKFINKCWEWLTDNFDKIEKKEKLEIVLKICVKNTPQDVGFVGDGSPFQIIIKRDEGKNGDNIAQISG